MHSAKIKILFVASMNADSGVAHFLMNYVRHMDLNKYDLHFLSIVNNKDSLKSELVNMGCTFYEATNFKTHPVKWLNQVRGIIKSNKFDIVHSNEAVMGLPALLFAKKFKVPVRIAHSHSAGMPSIWKTVVVFLCRPLFYGFSTCYFACSTKAGEYLFGKKIFHKKENMLVTNAIDVKQFRADNNIREEIRSQMKIADKLVIGHVGRFNYGKNHTFMIDILKELCFKQENIVLFMIGEGETKSKIEQKVKNSCLEKYALFLGKITDVNKYLSAMDVFLLPSFYEGLPVVGIEAQASGLPCIFSDRITEETAITDSCKFLPITDPKIWANEIQSTKIKSIYEREDINDNISKSYYDIIKAAERLENKYQSLVKNNTVI